MRNLGTIHGNNGNPLMVSARGGGVPNAMSFTDSAIASGRAKLVSELEKRDPMLRQPLTSITYPRDIPIATGGGWVDVISSMYVQYGISEGSGEGVIAASGANESKVIQANLSDEKWGTHVFDLTMRLGYIDVQRSKITGRSLDQIYQEGVRLTYDKHMESNGYVGFNSIGTAGLMNDPSVIARIVSTGAKGTTKFEDKTADEILFDVNRAIVTVWNQAENDLAAMPNHILMPHIHYNHIATAKVSEASDMTILTFIEKNNIITKQKGGNLFIGATNFCEGQGTGGTDRMIVYCMDNRYLEMEELVSLFRAMTENNVEKKAYDTLYLANLSELKMFYYETFGYFDGI